jgi:hypothetical protein
VFVRDIAPDERIMLASGWLGRADQRAPLAKIRDPHHTLARLVAQDKPVVEIAAITGYTPDRIRTLNIDPAFKELVHHYTMEQQSADADITAQIKHVTLSVLSEIQTRIEDEPEAFSNKELRDLAMAGLDRIGHGPSSKVDVRVTNTAKVIEAMNAQIQQDRGGRVLSRDEVIEVEYVETSQSDGADLGDDDAVWSIPESTETQRGSGGGAEISTLSPAK